MKSLRDRSDISLYLRFTENEMRAYAAGIIDGEGCVHISKKHLLRVVVAMTNTLPLTFLQQAFGGSIRERKGAYKASAKKQWIWEIIANEAVVFLDQIKPYLRVKQIEVDIAVLMQVGKKNRRSRRPDGTMSGSDPEMVKMHEFLRQTCKEEKRFNG